MNCLFCRIIQTEIPVKILYEDDQVMAFNDISPQAPIHFLLIPKRHIASLIELNATHQALAGHMLITAQRLAQQQGCDNGFRLVINCGDDGGQTVDHIHMHVLGKRVLQWPPG